MTTPAKFHFISCLNILKKNMFARMILFYSCFSILLIILSSYILITWSSRNLEKEIQKSNNLVLNQFKIYSDIYLLKRLDSIVSDKCLACSSDNSIYNFYTHFQPTDLNLTLDAWKSISSIVSNYDFIDSIYIFRGVDNTMVSSREGVIYNINRKDNLRYVNTAPLTAAKESSFKSGWVSPLENSGFSKNRAILSFYYNFIIVTSHRNYKCNIIFNIDEEKFFSSVLGTYGSGNPIFMVIDSHGNYLVHSNIQMLMKKPELPSDAIKSILSKNNGFMLTKSSNISEALTWNHSSVNDWNYVSIISADMLNKQVQIGERLGYGLIISIVLICIIGLSLITSILYKPLKNLILSIRPRFSSDDTDGDLFLIGNVINNLTNQVEAMEGVLMKNSPLILYKLVMDIIQDSISDNEELNKRFGLLNITFDFEFYCVMITEIKTSDFEKFPIVQREYLTACITEIINDSLKTEANLITICYPANCFLSIINYQEYEPLKNKLNALIKQLSDNWGVSANISVSCTCKTLLNLNKAYAKTSEQLRYSFITGRGNIFSYDTFANPGGLKADFTIHDMKHLESVLLSNKVSSFKEGVEDLVIQCKNFVFDLSSINKLIEQITDIVVQTSLQKGLSPLENDESKSADIFQRFSTIDSWMDWLFGLADILTAHISHKQLNINQDYMQSIMEFVQTHIECQLSLNSVAEEFKITPNYLSRIFKESTGTNFSDFITETKFSHAKKLLAMSEKRNISDIAESLGYLNLGYFTKIFKEKFSVTPVQYRKLYLSEKYTNNASVEN